MIAISNTISSNLSLQVKHLYEEAFPVHERRPWHEQLRLLHNGVLSFDEIKINSNFIGFIFYWQLADFTFIEHFALAPSERGKGAGTQIIKLIQDRFTTIVLETEPPQTNADAARRIQFYGRAGFILFEEDYMQPPYIQGNSFFPMKLMYWNTGGKKIAFDQIKHEIYSTVYGIC